MEEIAKKVDRMNRRVAELELKNQMTTGVRDRDRKKEIERDRYP